MYLIIRQYSQRRTAYITPDGESALKKMLAIAAEKEFDKITCIDMQERKEERLCVNCRK